MTLTEYTPRRADAIGKLNIPETDKPYRVKFLWFEMISREHGADKIYYGDHSHSFFELYLLFSGEAKCVIDGKEIVLSAGDALLLPPDISHRYVASKEPFLRAALAFSSCDLPLPRGEYKIFRISREVHENSEFILKHSENDDIFTPDLISGRLAETVALVTRELADTLPSFNRRAEDPRLSVAKDFIHNNRGRMLSGDDVAKECCISRKQLDRIFKSYTGKTVHDYLTSVRVEYAKQLLLGEKSVKEICYALGFENESGFVSFFKRHFGMPPGAYRKENNKER